MSTADPSPFQQLLQAICDADRKDAVYRAMSGYVADKGAVFWSYVRTMRTLQDVPLEDGFEFATFPEAWLTHYRDRNYFALDPTITAARHVTHPFHWFEVGALVRLSRAQLDFLDDARAFGITDGLSVPIFSAHGTAAYFAVGTDQGLWRLSDAATLEVALACQAVHQRVVALEGGEATGTSPLTPRETEVLGLVARGDSNGRIGARLGISERTVESLLGRVFAKLEVSDRVSATVRALALGLVSVEADDQSRDHHG